MHATSWGLEPFLQGGFSAWARPLTALLQASVHSQQSSCFESASAAVKQHASTPCDGTCHLHMGESTNGFGYKYS